ncbi:MAG: heme ABC exporter ATP-binding protein CcmA [Proteobacteria bacterium]|nr:heme ABC exporter ATP-binding protein CcmA [Pseudomonadota bacterium]
MLTVDNIIYYKNQQKIFQELGFTIGLHSCLLLTGKNGSGKTSLLKIIAGITQPTQGRVLWNNENIQEFYPEYSADIQYIGHKNFLKKKLTIIENLDFYSSLSDTQTLIPAALKYFQLDNIADKQVGKLSAGLQQRVMLAKLLCCPATIWLLDEPTSNLDKEGKELLFNLISIKVKEGGIAIVSTHDDDLLPLGKSLNLGDFAA